MKKTLLYTAIATLFGGASCSTDGQNDVTLEWNTPTINVITSLDDGSINMSAGRYAIKISQTGWTGDINSSSLVLNGGTSNLATDQGSYTTDGVNIFFKNLPGNVTGNVNMPISKGNFNLYSYYYNNTPVGKYSFAPYATAAIAANYQVGDAYLVRTFQPVTVFKGSTTTSYPNASGEIEHYNTDEIQYGVSIDMTNKTAAIVMFDSKFSASDKEPVKTVLIEGLNVEATSRGIRISGEDIIPGMLSGSEPLPIPNYIFNSIVFETTNEFLTEARLTFNVAGIYSGTFTGSYVYIPSYNNM